MHTMRFVSIYPKLISHYLEFGMMAQAQKKQLVSCKISNLRDFSSLPHRAVDAPPYGGGAGMVMRADVLAKAVQVHPHDYIITASPGAPYFDQKEAQRLYGLLESGRSLCFVCGRFSGMDERFVEKYVDCSYSVGDFVISGGELPCLIIAESVVRLVKGVLGNSLSVSEDSFGVSHPQSLNAPLYTRPEVFEGVPVPEVLRSGDHKAVEQWRKQSSEQRTLKHKLER